MFDSYEEVATAVTWITPSMIGTLKFNSPFEFDFIISVFVVEKEDMPEVTANVVSGFIGNKWIKQTFFKLNSSFNDDDNVWDDKISDLSINNENWSSSYSIFILLIWYEKFEVVKGLKLKCVEPLTPSVNSIPYFIRYNNIATIDGYSK